MQLRVAEQVVSDDTLHTVKHIFHTSAFTALCGAWTRAGSEAPSVSLDSWHFRQNCIESQGESDLSWDCADSLIPAGRDPCVVR